MTRIAGLVLCCCAAWLAACSRPAPAPALRAPAAATVATTPAAATTVAVEPRIVVQFGHQAPLLAVRWVDGGRHLVSLAGDGSIVVWDVANAAILDHAQVPLGAEAFGEGGPVLKALGPGPDARTLSIAYARDVRIPDPCPGAHRGAAPWCLYALDLATRAVRAAPDLAPPADAPTAGAAARDFPLSPDGAWRPVQNHADGRRGLFDTTDDNLQFADPTCVSPTRCRYGVTLLPARGQAAPVQLTGSPRSYFLDADLDADGLRLVRVEGLDNDTRARVETLDLGTGGGARAFTSERAYHRVRWLDATRYLLQSEGYTATDDTDDAMAGFPPALVVDPACTARGPCTALDSRWQVQPLDDAGALVALGRLDGCYRAHLRQPGSRGTFCPAAAGHADDGNRTEDPEATGLWRRAAGTPRWQPMREPALQGQAITAIATSPDRQRLAVATRAWDRADAPDAKQVLRVWVLGIGDAAGTPPRKRLEQVDPLPPAHAGGTRAFTDAGTVRALSFSADGARLVATRTRGADAGDAAADLYIVEADGDAPPRVVPGFSRRAVAIGNDRVLGLDTQQLLDTNSGEVVTGTQNNAPLLRAGWIARSRLLWGATDDGVIRFRDAADGTPQLTLYTFPGNRYFAVTPGGRYDTNLGADTALVRWLVPDAPWQSLAAQTFMRDYYEPGLVARLLDCRAAGSCAAVFPPLPSIASLNRVLPGVRITGVRPGRDAAQAVVSIEVDEGVDPSAPNGKTRSGAYNPRLFRNGRVVAMAPLQPDAGDDTLAAWRARNALPARARRLQFTVPLPTQGGQDAQVFTAYAFNEDRIKGDTATYRYARPPVAPRARNAYVVAIGINDYDTPRFRLNYSVADARLIASRLADIPGFRTRTLVLAGERRPDGTRSRVDRATFSRVLALLAGTGDRDATLRALQANGIDASVLQAATPDDLVLVTYSGHGWATPQGDFYLIPTGGRWREGEALPDLDTVLATADLVGPLRTMSAAEVALVIDACQSSASVANGRFKPGPMGDAGLGQLAYDKGIHILAATQANALAFEDPRLGQGLMTYALAVDGLAPTGGKADLDQDGDIGLDEWLGYAVQRLPTLGEDLRAGRIGAANAPRPSGGARAISFDDGDAPPVAPRVQRPSLFDFNPAPSTVVLGRSAR